MKNNSEKLAVKTLSLDNIVVHAQHPVPSAPMFLLTSPRFQAKSTSTSESGSKRRRDRKRCISCSDGPVLSVPEGNVHLSQADLLYPVFRPIETHLPLRDDRFPFKRLTPPRMRAVDLRRPREGSLPAPRSSATSTDIFS